MKKNIALTYCLVLILLCTSCFDSKYSSSKSDEKVWVYLEIETIMKKDTTNSYVYGEIKKSIIDKIERNENTRGLFFIDNVRYINDDDLLQIYEDRNDKGILGYRIEHITKMEMFKKDPILFFEKKKLDESSLKHLHRLSQK